MNSQIWLPHINCLESKINRFSKNNTGLAQWHTVQTNIQILVKVKFIGIEVNAHKINTINYMP